MGERSGRGSNWTWIKGQSHENTIKILVRCGDTRNKNWRAFGGEGQAGPG
jgi:hypothetical protein